MGVARLARARKFESRSSRPCSNFRVSVGLCYDCGSEGGNIRQRLRCWLLVSWSKADFVSSVARPMTAIDLKSFPPNYPSRSHVHALSAHHLRTETFVPGTWSGGISSPVGQGSSQESKTPTPKVWLGRAPGQKSPRPGRNAGVGVCDEPRSTGPESRLGAECLE